MHSLDSLFPSPVVADILRLFLSYPEDAFYQRLIAEKTKHTLFQVQKALGRIEATGLITKAKEGKRIYYQVDSNHPSFFGLQQAFLTDSNFEQFEENWEDENPIPGAQIAFFHTIPGEEEPSCYLFVLGDIEENDFEQAIDRLSKRTGWEYIYTMMWTEEEFLKRFTKASAIPHHMKECKKIWLVGNDQLFHSILNHLPD